MPENVKDLTWPVLASAAMAIFGAGVTWSVLNERVEDLEKWANDHPSLIALSKVLDKVDRHARLLEGPRWTAHQEEEFQRQLRSELTERTIATREELAQIRKELENLRERTGKSQDAFAKLTGDLLEQITRLYDIMVSMEARIKRLEVIEGIYVPATVHTLQNGQADQE